MTACEDNRPRRAGDVERVHGGRQQFHGALGHQGAKGCPSQAPRRAERRSLRQEQQLRATSCDAKSAKHANFAAPPHHGNRDRVVNQERANHQRNAAKDTQVPAKGAQHAAIRVRARAEGAKLHAGWKCILNGCSSCGFVYAFGHIHFNAVHQGSAPGERLCHRQIHHNHPIGAGAGVVFLPGEDSRHRQSFGAVLNRNAQRVAGLLAKPRPHPGRTGVIEDFEARLFTDDDVALSVGYQVDANQGCGNATCFIGNVFFDARLKTQGKRQRGQPAKSLLWNSSWRGDLQRRFTRQRFHTRTEGTRRREARKVNGDHHRHSQRYRNEGK